MDDRVNISGLVDHFVLQKALEWLSENADIPIEVLRRVDRLNAEKCGVPADEVCRVWL